MEFFCTFYSDEKFGFSTLIPFSLLLHNAENITILQGKCANAAWNLGIILQTNSLPRTYCRVSNAELVTCSKSTHAIHQGSPLRLYSLSLLCTRIFEEFWKLEYKKEKKNTNSHYHIFLELLLRICNLGKG